MPQIRPLTDIVHFKYAHASMSYCCRFTLIAKVAGPLLSRVTLVQATYSPSRVKSSKFYYFNSETTVITQR